MAGSSLFALIDDIATILDDVGAMSKVAVEKTAGVLGDDLALNAQQITGVNPNRELPVVWAVAKGSMLNKVILVPAALGISAIAPWAVSPLLMIGGAFLCFEGFEKIIHKFLHPKKKEEQQQERTEALKALADPQTDLVKVEKSKIAGAIRTDFILSAEIVVIALGTLAATTFAMRVAVLSTIAVVMTAGVYGLVAAIIKMDDLGLFLSKRQGDSGVRGFERWVGRAILVMAPYLLRLLSIVGTAAMFLVGGHILMAGVPALHHWYEETVHHLAEVPTVGFLLEFFAPIVIDGGAGILTGAAIVLVVESIKRVLWKKSSSHH